jgi:rhodanese-related sulfurtransferase
LSGGAQFQILTIPEYRSRLVEPGRAHLLIDVRTPEEYSGGHIPGAINLPLARIASGAFTLLGDRPIAVVCNNGQRSRQAAQFLADAGFAPVIYLQGGTAAWVLQGWPLERNSQSQE